MSSSHALETALTQRQPQDLPCRPSLSDGHDSIGGRGQQYSTAVTLTVREFRT